MALNVQIFSRNASRPVQIHKMRTGAPALAHLALALHGRIQYPFAVATTCRSCGAVLPEGASRCPACLAIVKPSRWWRRDAVQTKSETPTGRAERARASATPSTSDPPSFFQRLFGGLKLNVSLSTSPGRVQKPLVDFHKTVRHSETFQIQDARTGERKVYHSLDEVPEEYREKLRVAMPLANVTRSQHVTITPGHVTRTQQITVIGPDGVPQTYKSMDEVPESVRELMKLAQPPPPAE